MTLPEYFEQRCGQIISALQEEHSLLRSLIEVLLNDDAVAPVRVALERGIMDGLVERFGYSGEELADEESRALWGMYQALMVGVRLMHLATPDQSKDWLTGNTRTERRDWRRSGFFSNSDRTLVLRGWLDEDLAFREGCAVGNRSLR